MPIFRPMDALVSESTEWAEVVRLAVARLDLVGDGVSLQALYVELDHVPHLQAKPQWRRTIRQALRAHPALVRVGWRRWAVRPTRS